MPSKAIQNKTKTDQPYVCPFTMNFRQKPTLYQTLQAKSFRKNKQTIKFNIKTSVLRNFGKAVFSSEVLVMKKFYGNYKAK